MGPFLNDFGNLITNPESIVEMLKNQYEGVYSSPVEAMEIVHPDNFFKTSDAEEQLDNIVFDRIGILEAIDKLLNNSNPGPDGISSILLKKC